MSFAGFKKQFNKTSQFLSEKVGGNKGSEVDEVIVEFGRKMDVVNECVENMQTKTKEYLQPNPNARTKMAMQSSYQKARGQVASVKYPQAEYNLAEVFHRYSGGLNDMSPYATALGELGTAFNEMSEYKDHMELSVTQNFLDPLYEMQQKELKEISHHRKKLEGRRLDFDYKKSKGDKVTHEELMMAENKFDESKQLCSDSMANFMENDVEHITQLLAFAESIRDYHQQCSQTMASLTEILNTKLSEAASQPRIERRNVLSSSFRKSDNISVNSYDDISAPSAPIAPPKKSSVLISAPVMQQPWCRAIYDFQAENEGELSFDEGAIIQLTSRIDENWLEGTVNGRSGYFPESFVEIQVPI